MSGQIARVIADFGHKFLPKFRGVGPLIFPKQRQAKKVMRVRRRFKLYFDRLHFGLAGDAVMSKVEIRWPNGGLETIQNVSADAIYTIVEGQGIKSSVNLRLRLRAEVPSSSLD